MAGMILQKKRRADWMRGLTDLLIPREPAEELARAAERKGDWQAALHEWSFLRRTAPDRRDAFLGVTTALSQLGQETEAADLFAAAPAAFNDHLDFALCRAITTQNTHGAAPALALWQSIRERFPEHPYAYSAIAGLHLAGAAPDDAEHAIGMALQQFSPDADMLATAILIAIARRDWESAAARLEKLHAALPDHPFTLSAAAGLRQNIESGLLQDRYGGWRAAAAAAEAAGDWKEAGRLWDKLYAAGVTPRDSLLGAARARREAGDLTGASAAFDKALAAWPDDLEICANHAQLAAKAEDWPHAAARWRDILGRFPHTDLFADMAADAFYHAGQIDEARALISGAVAKHPDRVNYRIGYATFHQREGNWPEAVTQWRAVVQLMPADAILAKLLGDAIWNAKLAGQACAEANPEMPPLAQLMLMFESLGDNCELGLVQRHFGAEPLGLFRFSATRPHHLLRLLQEDFLSLGDPAHTLVELSEDDYVIKDDRELYWMHSFFRKGDIDPARLLTQQIKRIGFLKRELLEDLRSGEKIYVCKDSKAAISDATLGEIAAGLNRHGKNLLLGIRLADAEHPAGTVARLAETILAGYLDAMFVQHGTAMQGEAHHFAVWKAVLEAAYEYKIGGFRAAPLAG